MTLFTKSLLLVLIVTQGTFAFAADDDCSIKIEYRRLTSETKGILEDKGYTPVEPGEATRFVVSIRQVGGGGLGNGGEGKDAIRIDLNTQAHVELSTVAPDGNKILLDSAYSSVERTISTAIAEGDSLDELAVEQALVNLSSCQAIKHQYLGKI